MPFTRTRGAALGTAVLIAAGLATPPATATAAAAEDAAQVTVRLDPSYQQQPFQGWGTALGWFADVTGGWPAKARNRLADDLYGADGLGFTIARYNIGGGDSPETPPYMRAGAAVPGHWNRPAEYGPPADAGEDWKETPDWWDPENPRHWNPKADANQRWWLKAAKQRGADTFEAFSNSPPYFMTNSGLVSGAKEGDKDNLRPDQYGRFASYLSGALDRVEDSTGVDFDSVSPVNEPNTNYWKAGGRQEGSHWDPSSQARMVSTLRDRLDADGLDTPVAAMDETNPQIFRTNWEFYSPSVRSDIGRLNTHTYGTAGRPAVRDISKGSGIPLWMSEVDLGGSVGQSFTSMSPALDLTKRINDDIKELEPSAWVLWQAVEDYENMTPDRENSNWGLIQTDFTPADAATEPLRKNKKYWAMANYSRFIRPGARVINTDGTGTLAALRPGGRGTTVVHTNATNQAQEVTFDLSGFRSLSTAPVQRYTTDATKNVAREADLSVDRKHERLTATVAPGSVTTFVLPGATGTDPAATTAPTDAPRHLVNDNSGKSLSAPSDGTATPVQRTTDVKDTAQQWKFTKVSGSWSSTAAYRVTNVGTGKALSVGSEGSAATLVTPASGARQQWMLSTTGGGHYVLVNKATGQVLDVTGAATHDGAPVGTYTPNAGSNQSWRLPRDARSTGGPLSG